MPDRRFFPIVMVFLVFSCLPVFSVEFTDSVGRSVDVGGTGAVACLNSSLADIWTLAGGKVDITVGDAVSKGYAGTDAVLVDSGAGISIDLEMLVYSRPDFVLASADTPSHVRASEKLDDLKIPNALVRLDCFDDFYNIFSTLTKITGRMDLFEIHGEGQRKEIGRIVEKALQNDERPSVLFIRAGSGFSSTRAKTRDEHFAAGILYDLGAGNIADSAPVLSEGLSLEAVLVGDPDFILVVPQGNEDAGIAYMKDLLDRPGWRSLRAVRDGHVFFLPKELFHYKPNGRWAKAYELMADILYPEASE